MGSTILRIVLTFSVVCGEILTNASRIHVDIPAKLAERHNTVTVGVGGSLVESGVPPDPALTESEDRAPADGSNAVGVPKNLVEAIIERLFQEDRFNARLKELLLASPASGDSVRGGSRIVADDAAYLKRQKRSDVDGGSPAVPFFMQPENSDEDEHEDSKEQESKPTTGAVSGVKKTMEDRVLALEAKLRKTEARSCEQLRKAGEKTSGHYYVDPDGVDIGEPPIFVFCEFDLTRGVAETVIVHDLAKKTVDVHHCPLPGCSKHEPVYEVPVAQINALIEISADCSQEISYNCNLAPLSSWGRIANAWWIGRGKRINTYWSGPHTADHVCDCGLHNNCTVEPSLKCNCDASAPEWFTDAGILTDRKSLPVQSLHFGGFRYPSQKARFSLGPLKCSGSDNQALSKFDSCRSMQIMGHRAPGYYLLDSAATATPVTADLSEENEVDEILDEVSTLFLPLPGHRKSRNDKIGGQSLAPSRRADRIAKCSFDLDTSHPAFEETVFKFPKPVAFSVQRMIAFTVPNDETQRSSAAPPPSTVTYDTVNLNLGHGMNKTTGAFTAPTKGVYSLTFSAECSGFYYRRSAYESYKFNEISAEMIKNDDHKALASSNAHRCTETSSSSCLKTFALTAVVQLEAGDTVSNRVLGSCVAGKTRFSGFVLHEM